MVRMRSTVQARHDSWPHFAGVAELADALDLGSSVFGRVGSSPTTRIRHNNIYHIYILPI